jgi:hypothetical protein
LYNFCAVSSIVFMKISCGCLLAKAFYDKNLVQI